MLYHNNLFIFYLPFIYILFTIYLYFIFYLPFKMGRTTNKFTMTDINQENEYFMNSVIHQLRSSGDF